jgi:membrane associated rhomboid family serine protease
MPNASHTIREELVNILLFLGFIWFVFFVQVTFPGLHLDNYGITPRTTPGLIGIPCMVFLHASFQHIYANTIPLFFLLALLAGSRARSWEIVLEIVLLGGLLLWAFGRPTRDGVPMVHIGASGLIFGLIAFLIVSGILEQRIIPLCISILVGFCYGGTLLAGIMPQEVHSRISWEGHLYGAIAGAVVAYYLTAESDDEKKKSAEESSTPS